MLALGIIALAIGAGLGFWLIRDQPGLVAAAAQTRAPIMSPIVSIGRARHIPPPRPAVLPAIDTPLAQIIEDLSRRTRQGDAAAGCRLAAEYLHCAKLPHWELDHQRWIAEREQALESLDSGDALEEMAASFDRELLLRRRRLQSLRTHCEGVDVPGAAALAKLWRDSARLGNPAAMKQYASGNAFRWNSLFDVLPELQLYRREAERIATVGAQRGDLDLALALAAAYSPVREGNRPFLSQIVAPDGARALALFLHVERAASGAGPRGEPLRSQVRLRVAELQKLLSATERARANDIADHELRSWRAPEPKGLHLLDASGRVPDVERNWCAR